MWYGWVYDSSIDNKKTSNLPNCFENGRSSFVVFEKIAKTWNLRFFRRLVRFFDGCEVTNPLNQSSKTKGYENTKLLYAPPMNSQYAFASYVIPK